MRQLGYVADDLDAAIAWWVDIAKIGPWFRLEPTDLCGLSLRGVGLAPISVSAAFANSGDLQIELIQQHCSTRSLYNAAASRAPASASGILHHWSAWLDPAQYGAIRELALSEGYTAEMEAGHDHGGFIYLSKKGSKAPYIELAAGYAWRMRFFDKVRKAAVDWDGRDPVRDRHGKTLSLKGRTSGVGF